MADDHRLNFVFLIDEKSRVCVAIWVGRRCMFKEIVPVTEKLTSFYPATLFFLSDLGSELIAHAFRCWCKISGTNTSYIETVSTWQNGLDESFYC